MTSRRHERLDQIVLEAQEAWQCWLEAGGITDASNAHHVRGFALQVLEQLASSTRAPVQNIIDGIEKELLKIYPDAETVARIALSLVGAIHEVGRADAAQPVELSLAWLEERTDFRLLPRDLLPASPVDACDYQVENACRDEWSEKACVRRGALEAAFSGFYSSDRSLFVLVGDSGTGKSWAVAAEASLTLAGRIRCLIRGSDLTTDKPLASIVAQAFRSLGRPDASDETLFRYLLASAADPARGPLVVFADDVPLSGDPGTLEAALERRCREARELRVKLVVVARQSVWLRLSRQGRLASFLYRGSIAPGEVTQHSYRLGSLTHEEKERILRIQGSGQWDPERIILALRRPEFSMLGNAYVFSIYLQRVRAGTLAPLAPPSIDALLDHEIERRFGRVADQVGCEADEIADARRELVPHLWESRRDGARSSLLISLLEAAIPGSGREALQALQREDILTAAGDLRSVAGGNVTYANPQFGERLTARWLAARLDSGQEALPELEPGLDDGVLTALARSAIDGVVPDVISWAEALFRRDPRWLPALAQGLSQRTGEDWRIPALLTAWARRNESGSSYHAMRALGSMAGRSAYARAWIGTLYADEDTWQYLNGGIALGSALDVTPRWVERQIRLRLRREVQRENRWPNDRERQYRFIRSALDPLTEVNHSQAAAVARRLLEWIQAHPLANRERDRIAAREQFTDVADAICGRIALFGSESDLQDILSELGSDNHHVRAGAARALAAFVEETPEPVKDAVITAASAETVVPVPFHDLLYRYADHEPDAVAEAIEASGVLSTWRCGMALMILARIATSRAGRVEPLLLERLGLEACERSLLSEPLAFAWWQTAAVQPVAARARGVLEQLSHPDLHGVPEEYRVFAIRGAAVALIARIALDIGEMSAAAREVNVFYHHLAAETNCGFCYADFRELCGRFAPQIIAHPLGGQLTELYCEAIRVYADHEMGPDRRPMAEWQFRVANLCADELSAVAVCLPEPTQLVAELPNDWQALRVSQAVLRAGRASDALIAHACGICQEHHNVIGDNICSDRDAFLLDLRAAGRLPEPYRALADRIASQSEYGLAGMEAATTDRAETLLDELHERVTRKTAVPFLWEWSSTPRDWRGALVGNVFRAMFARAPLTADCCRGLIDQMLIAVEALPPSPRRSEWSAVYLALRGFSLGHPVSDETLRHTGSGNDLMTCSHREALTLVKLFQTERHRRDPDWLEEWIGSGAGWVTDQWHRIKDGQVVRQSGYPPTAYFPPALRLALAIASIREQRDEFVADWTRRWDRIGHALEDGALGRLRYIDGVRQSDYRKRLLEQTEVETDALLREFPTDSRVHSARGLVLLYQQRFQSAREAFEACLGAPSFGLGTHENARYNLACCLAQLGEATECRRLLESVLPRDPDLRSHAADDPDFESVRCERWFQDLVNAVVE